MRQKLSQYLLWPNVRFKTSWTLYDFFKQPSGIFHKRFSSLKVQLCVFVRLWSTFIHLQSVIALTTSFKDIMKTHRRKNHMNVTLSDHFSMNSPFVKQEVIPASYTSWLWGAPLPLDTNISTVNLSAQTRVCDGVTPEAQLFCSHIVLHSTVILI